jgi:hypothetical protein
MFNLIFPTLEQAEIYVYYDKISVENENKILLQKKCIGGCRVME